ncbi:MAG TPA: hypothetical protein VKZ53_08290 [Candidatus Angelobacter sp.]|nr:hypothetical protein [Candidatus Angelobacter sp.]
MTNFSRIAALALVALFSLAGGYVHADDGCSNRTLHGRYGVQVSGTSAALGMDSAVFDFVADGRGAIPSGSATEVFRRSLDLVNITFTGTYSVNADCTGTLTINDNLGGTTVDTFVVSEDGRRIVLADDTALGNVLTGTGERQSRDADKACSAESLKGQFSLVETGIEDLVPFTIVGRLTADGKGNVTSGTATIAQAPVVILNEPAVLAANQSFTGTYTVNADCSGTLALVQGTTPLRSFSLVLADSGRKIFLADVRDGDAIDSLSAVAQKLTSRDEDEE